MNQSRLPIRADLTHVDTWIFDLDNTLYPATSRLFDQIDVRIGQFIAQTFDVDRKEARKIQKSYFREHGTTLRGLMTEHGMAPEAFLAFVHDIDFSPLQPTAGLEAALAALPGRKLIFTNADMPYSRKVLACLGVAHHFEHIYDIAAANYVPKPFPAAYDTLIEVYEIEPAGAIFFEDIARNLVPAAALGMTTVWVRGDDNWVLPGNEDAKPDFETDDLVAWLDEALNGQ
ncbi:MAG: pyrimidine 5'-nucleotidase [Alphaproteobacteria bacterium]|jgi:putative hydrolase of the HAD superfamily|nr:pyrimidine 5'-nucleotidase [Alphaproteobacteria bacterium]MDP6588906.1 pyrimidine 5'-nucleotidase [Alphaproteobacteria bacterium]MDP6817458.1 pyrimidine 5'-nucleotidase [Alphaproteobacteria bacterium]|tara:strand:- start:840 stop:1529 length:690 start_codon:yes stop_codon:yes gene_type:complete